jgi:hypothetical protein
MFDKTGGLFSSSASWIRVTKSASRVRVIVFSAWILPPPESARPGVEIRMAYRKINKQYPHIFCRVILMRRIFALSTIINES